MAGRYKIDQAEVKRIQVEKAKVLNGYTVENGIIKDPGKFEACAEHVLYYWDAYLNGFTDGDDGRILKFKVTHEERFVFPALAGVRMVKLYENDNGFVCEA